MGRPLLLLLVALSFLHAASPNPCSSLDLNSLESFAKGLASGSIPTWQFNSSSISCCQWVGITCDDSTTTRVIKLKLPNMGLRGIIAKGSLGSLDRLVELDLANNSLTGTVPRKLFMLPELASLNFSRNKLEGSIPPDTSLPSIQELDLSFNGFSGDLPESLFRSTSLTNLYLQKNRFGGPLPARIGDLTNLVELDISSNRLEGIIPDAFDRLSILTSLSLSRNSFVGNLPSSFSSLESIQELNLNKNSLDGPIDLNFSRMPRLSSIDLGSNFLNGAIPAGLSSCPRLKTINLARNRLTGEIPASFAELAVLEFLSLSNNSLANFTSAMETLQHCPNLTTLVVTINFRGDAFPSDGITGFKTLRALVAANCGLSGSVPRWLSQCGNLQLLDLSWNRLRGSIPTWFGGLSLLFYIDLSNNTLSGEVPWSSFANIAALVRGNSSERGSLSSTDLPFFSKQGDRVVALQYNQLGSFPPTLDLSDNIYLTGTISPKVGELRKIHILDLSNNSFEGSIPDELSELTSLEHLDLSLNQLGGKIPPSLTGLSFLSKFNVSYNNLNGSIPVNGQFSTFKPSSYEGNVGLCGAPLPLCGSQLEPPSSTHRRGVNKGVVAGIALGIGLGVVILLFLLYMAISRTRSRRIEDTEKDLSFGSNHHMEQPDSSLVLFFQAKEPGSLSIDDILKSTGNFDQANIIGCGGFGLVYKATLPTGHHVAIKRLSGEFGQMEREFQAEVETLSQAQHNHLVSLRGYCKIGKDRLLIYSYMEHGSLDYWLHETDQATLDWATRLRIARGAARGLAYLHQSCDPHILHRDIKSSNILLDSNFEAHLADFGLARLMLPCDTHVTTDLVGTLGYIPPEYAQSPVATMKGDVYSFGVVLLELLTGRRPMDMCRPKESRDLISWVVWMRGQGREGEVFDGNEYDRSCESEMARVLELACRCLRESPKERPSIQQVVAWLDDVENSTQTH